MFDNLLHLFRSPDGDGGTAGSETAGEGFDQNAGTDADARAARFDELIKGEYADLYNARVQEQISRRFKSVKEAKDVEAKYAPAFQKLALRYGRDAGDIDGILSAMDEDDSYYEKEADERGLTVKELKSIKKLEAENAQLRKAREEAENQKKTDEILRGWNEEAEQLQQIYPSFDFQTELQNQDFFDLISKGVNLKTAYQVIHQDEIIGGAMAYTAEQTRQQVVNNIKARGARPRENGAGGAASGLIHTTDPGKLSKSEREALEKRALRGERITFTE